MASQLVASDTPEIIDNNQHQHEPSGTNDNNLDRQQVVVVATQMGQPNRKRLSKLLQLHGYSACREALVLLDDHYNSSFHHYESMENFISILNRVITFETGISSSVIDPDLAHLAIQKLCNRFKTQQQQQLLDENDQQELVDLEPQPPKELIVRLKNVASDQPISAEEQLDAGNKAPTTRNQPPGSGGASSSTRFTQKEADEFNIHYNFLLKRLNCLPIFQGDFKLTSLATLTGSNQPQIRCICFGLLIKDIYKIDGYLLIDSTGRVPVRITQDTAFRNKLAYSNCIVLVEGLYVNPDDVLYAANVGLPPILLDPIEPKSLACAEDKSIIILKELFLDDEDVCKALEKFFDKYNDCDQPPMMFILIGDFTRQAYDAPEVYHHYTKKLVDIIRTCDKLKNSHFVFVPGPKDTLPKEALKAIDSPSSQQLLSKMPKTPLTREQLPVNLLNLSHFENIHLASNPSHIYLGERQISVVSHSYLKELKNNLLHDLHDRDEEYFDTVKQIMISNAHMSAGVSKTMHTSMNLWHKPDLLILADTKADGARYNHSSSSDLDTSFSTVPSFSRQFNKYKVYYIQSGRVEDSRVS